MRKKFGLEKTPILWLSSAEKEYAVAPNKLSELFYKMNTFMEEGEKNVIMISGIEYLITQNNYLSVLKFLQLLNEQIAISNAILLVPLEKDSLPAQDYKLIERELTPLDVGDE